MKNIAVFNNSTGVVGADDYVTSCDSPLVIAAKVKAQLRRYTKEYGSYRQLMQKML